MKCPHCSKDIDLKCLRCGHIWVPRDNELPQTCPKCRSPYWNKERKFIRVSLKKDVDVNKLIEVLKGVNKSQKEFLKNVKKLER